MTVAKQPAVYTHTCDRCQATVTSGGGNAGEHAWERVDVHVDGEHGNVRDLCAVCVEAFACFMRGETVESLGSIRMSAS
jgi:hypothetical protein